MATSITFTRGKNLETIVFDSAKSIKPSFESDVTEHPVERGANATDNSRRKPDTLTIEALLTDYPVTINGGGIGAKPEAERAKGLLNTLLKLQTDGVRLLVITSLKEYNNMVISSIAPTTDGLKGALKLTINFVQIQIVDTAVVEITRVVKNRIAAKKVDKGEKTGEKATENQKLESVAHKTKGGIRDAVGGIVDGFKKVLGQ